VWDRFFAGRRVVNLGYGWDRTENVLWRLTHGEFNDVSPKVVVVLIGTNNIDRKHAGRDRRRHHGHLRRASSPCPCRSHPAARHFSARRDADATRAKVDAVNERIARLDGTGGVNYLDLVKTFLQADGSISSDVMYDFLHPTAKGYAMWAAAMEPTLNRLIAR
jgi:lysophospholipase L1-like esterase